MHSAAQPDGPELACSFPSGLPRVSFVFLSKAHETVELAHLMRGRWNQSIIFAFVVYSRVAWEGLGFRR